MNLVRSYLSSSIITLIVVAVDHSFINTFLMTYQTFTSSNELFDLLVDRYFIKPPPDLNPQELQLWSDKKQKIIQIR